MELIGYLTSSDTIVGFVSETATLSGIMERPKEAHPTYSGTYEVVPSSEEQVIPTAHRVLVNDILVRPVPQNYGLITWNGSYLTVS